MYYYAVYGVTPTHATKIMYLKSKTPIRSKKSQKLVDDLHGQFSFVNYIAPVTIFAYLFHTKIRKPSGK
jgi:hypothetical protein